MGKKNPIATIAICLVRTSLVHLLEKMNIMTNLYDDKLFKLYTDYWCREMKVYL